MKRIFLIFLVCLLGVFANAQTSGFPNTSSEGSPQTLRYNKGAYGANLGIAWLLSFADTTAANLNSSVKNTDGIVIRCTGEIYWVRNVTLNKWFIFGGSAGIGVNIYNSDGTLSGDRLLTGNNKALTFQAVRDFKVEANEQIDLFAGTNFKVRGLPQKTAGTDSVLVRDVNGIVGTVAKSSIGSTNPNAGSGYRLGIPNKDSIKTLSPGYGVLFDSLIANQIGAKVDTGTLFPAIRGFSTLQHVTDYGNTTTNSISVEYGLRIGRDNVPNLSTIAIGGNALQSVTTGYDNLALGDAALFSNTSGHENLAIGLSALGSNISGNFNTAIGKNALLTSRFNQHNTAVGYNALSQSDGGAFNTAIGAESQLATTTGGVNTSLGALSLKNNQTGDKNTAIGAGAMENNNSGTHNVAVGYDALLGVQGGHYNVGVGWNTYANLLVGDQNVGVGRRSGATLTEGNDNIFIGTDAGFNVLQKVDVVNSIAVGTSMYTTEDNQAIFGSFTTTQTWFPGAAESSLIIGDPDGNSVIWNREDGSSADLSVETSNGTNQFGSFSVGSNFIGLTVSEGILGTGVEMGASSFRVTDKDENVFFNINIEDDVYVLGDENGTINGQAIIIDDAAEKAFFRLANIGTASIGDVITLVDEATGEWQWAAPSGGGGTPAGNYGNVQLNRNGAFATPASDSLDFDGGIVVKGDITSSTLTSGRLTYATTGGKLTDNAAFTVDPSATGGIVHFRKDQASTNEATVTKVYLTNASASGIGLWGFTSDGTTNAGGFQYNNSTIGKNIFFYSAADFPIYLGTNNTVMMTVGAGANSGNIGINITSPTEKLHVAGNVRFSGALMPNNLAGSVDEFLVSAGSGAPPIWKALPVLDEGEFTPTTSNTTNASASTPYITQYIRVGDRVTVAGTIDIDPTATGAVEVRMTVPINTGFTDDLDAGGTANSGAVAGESAAITAVNATSTVAIKFIAVDITNKKYSFTYTYKITPP